MWNTNDEKGNPKELGKSYYPGVEFKPFKPEDMSIVGYKGRMMTLENLSKNKGKQWNSVCRHNLFYNTAMENLVFIIATPELN